MSKKNLETLECTFYTYENNEIVHKFSKITGKISINSKFCKQDGLNHIIKIKKKDKVLFGWVHTEEKYKEAFRRISEDLYREKKLAVLIDCSPEFGIYLIPPAVVSEDLEKRYNWNIKYPQEREKNETLLYFVAYCKKESPSRNESASSKPTSTQTSPPKIIKVESIEHIQESPSEIKLLNCESLAETDKQQNEKPQQITQIEEKNKDRMQNPSKADKLYPIISDTSFQEKTVTPTKMAEIQNQDLLQSQIAPRKKSGEEEPSTPNHLIRNGKSAPPALSSDSKENTEKSVNLNSTTSQPIQDTTQQSGGIYSLQNNQIFYPSQLPTNLPMFTNGFFYPRINQGGHYRPAPYGNWFPSYPQSLPSVVNSPTNIYPSFNVNLQNYPSYLQGSKMMDYQPSKNQNEQKKDESRNKESKR